MIKTVFLYILLFLLVCCSSNKLEQKSEEEKKAEIYFTYGTEKLMKNDHAGGLDNLRKAYEIEPESTKINNNLGLAYYLRGDSQKAQMHFDKAIELDPKNSDAKVNLASLYFSKGKIKKAKHLYQLVQKDLVYPSQFRVYYNLGLINLKEKNYQQAIKNFNLSISEYSDYCPPYYQLGILQRELGQIKKAIETLTDGIKGQCYEKPATLYQLGRTYFEHGDFLQAKKRFEDLNLRFPKSPYSSEVLKMLKKIPGNDTEKMRVRNNYRQDKIKKRNYNEGIIK